MAKPDDPSGFDGFPHGTKRFAEGEGRSQRPPACVDDLSDPFRQAEFLFRHEEDKIQWSRIEYFRVISALYGRVKELEDEWDRQHGHDRPDRRTMRSD